MPEQARTGERKYSTLPYLSLGTLHSVSLSCNASRLGKEKKPKVLVKVKLKVEYLAKLQRCLKLKIGCEKTTYVVRLLR